MTAPQVGDTWYRYVFRYPWNDDFEPSIGCRTYRVMRVTPCGVWLQESYNGHVYHEDKILQFWCSNNSNSSKAKPTRELAWKSFKIRMDRRHDKAKREFELVSEIIQIADRDGMPVPGKAGGGKPRRVGMRGLGVDPGMDDVLENGMVRMVSPTNS